MELTKLQTQILNAVEPKIAVEASAASGKTRLLEKLKQDTSINAEFIDDCGCELSQVELIQYAKELKEKSKYKQVIVASIQKEIIDVADKLIKL